MPTVFLALLEYVCVSMCVCLSLSLVTGCASSYPLSQGLVPAAEGHRDRVRRDPCDLWTTAVLLVAGRGRNLDSEYYNERYL